MKLTKTQKLFIETVLSAVQNNPELVSFTTCKRTGKSTALKELDKYFDKNTRVLGIDEIKLINPFIK